MAAVAHADPDADLTVAIAACEHEAADQCLDAATQMDRRHVATRLGHTPDDLRTRGQHLLETQCTAGTGDACYALGRQLERHGHGDDVARGHGLVERGCDLHSGRACLDLALGATSPAVAIQRFDQACAAGNADGCEQLARRVPSRARELHGKACDGGNLGGCLRSGELALAAGKRADAAARFTSACDLGDAASCDRAGTLTADATAARALLERACDQDVAAGCAHLAPFVAKGQGGARDWGHGLALATKSCELAHATTCALVAELRRHPPDPRCDDVTECKRMCDEQIAGSCRLLAERVAIDARPELYRNACDLGDAKSCAIAGDGADEVVSAADLYARACKLGDARSCTYARYTDAARGSKPARDALRRACATDVDACIVLGMVFEPTDKHEAGRLWRDACRRRPGAACRLAAYGSAHSSQDVGPLCWTPDARNDRDCFAESDRLGQQACDAGDALGCADITRRHCIEGDRAACSAAADRAPASAPAWPVSVPAWE